MTVRSKFVQGVLILATALAGVAIGQQQAFFALVRGRSMEPTLHSGQLLRLNHALPRQIPRGTIVLVSRFPRPPCIKRIVGLPNETVSFRLGEVFINGHMLREPYLPECQTTFSWKQDRLTAHDEEYVVLGDNRLTSQDSRDYGVIPRNRILAAVPMDSAPAQFLSRPYFRLTKHGLPPAPVPL